MVDERRFRYTAFFSLGFLALCEVMIVLCFERGVLLIQNYGNIPAFAFMAIALLSGRIRRTDYMVGAASVMWFVVSRVLMGELYLEYSWFFLLNMVSAYCFALPYACVTNDAAQHTGLRLTAWIYMTALSIIGGLGIAAVLKGGSLVLPVLHTSFALDEYRRLCMGNSCNISGQMMTLGLIAAGLIYATKPGWKRAAALMAPVLAMYTALSLTASRVALVECAFWAAGIVGAVLLPRAGKRPVRIAAVLCICAVMFAVVMGISEPLRSGVNTIAQWLAQVQQRDAVVLSSRSLLQNIGSLGMRTQVYQAVGQLLTDQPHIWLTGQLNSKMVQNLMRYTDAPHAHSSYLQMLLNTGLPGLVSALWFTGRAIWTAYGVFFRHAASSTLLQKLVALCTVTLLLAGLMESYLFTEFLTLCNLLFFLCFGYLLEARRMLDGK